MEIEEIKKISRYDEYNINEFTRSLLKTRENIKIAKLNLAERADNVSKRLQDTEREITSEELLQEEEEIGNIKKENEQNAKILRDWENEKERIHNVLIKKKEEKENKIIENEQKIKDLEDNIQQNEEKIKELDPESKEYAELEENIKKSQKKISRTKGVIKRYENKIKSLADIIKNLEEENVLEGLNPPKTIERATTLLGKNIKQLDETQKEENGSKAINETQNAEYTKEVEGLEEQIKNSVKRMKEYKENGNYNQEAEEHKYYNSLVSKLNDLKTKSEKTATIEEKQPPKNETATATQTEQTAQTAKATATKKEQSAKTVKTTIKTEQPSQTAKVIATRIEQQAQTATMAKVKVEEPVQAEPKGTEQTTQKEVQWNSKLTPEQIEELIAEGIEPGDNEYNLYLWNHGINPFETQMKSKATQQSEKDEVLQKYENEGFGKNASGWYFNPWTSEYEEDYDPHKDPEYNDKIEEESTTSKKDKVEKEVVTETNEIEKPSLKQKIKNLYNKMKDTLKRYIANFNNKQLPEGTEDEPVKEGDVSKANEILEETLSTESVLTQNTRRAMQGRNEFVSKVHISDELMQKIENDEQQKNEEIDQESER